MPHCPARSFPSKVNSHHTEGRLVTRRVSARVCESKCLCSGREPNHILRIRAIQLLYSPRELMVINNDSILNNNKVKIIQDCVLLKESFALPFERIQQTFHQKLSSCYIQMCYYLQPTPDMTRWIDHCRRQTLCILVRITVEKLNVGSLVK